MNYKDKQIKNLKEQNVALENYFKNTIVPQLFIDANLILRKFTPAAIKQFDLSPDDVDKSIYDIINNLRFPSIIQNIQQVIDSVEILQKEIQTTDLKWYQMNIIPYIEKDNKANGVIITFIDIDSRIKDLQELEKIISDYETLLDTISHDIRNPLNNLLLSVEMITDNTLERPNEFKPIIKIIKNGIRKLKNIINDLTETRKDEQHHKYKVTDELLNFENIIEDASVSLIDEIKESGAIITTELNISEIFFSRRKLRSIIYNLLNNALKFKSPERKPEIFIRTIKENNFIILSIKDNGIGIDATKQKNIFKKYYRIDNSIDGSGIGLHLVSQLVNNAGGKIFIESQINKGTEFKIYFKLK